MAKSKLVEANKKIEENVVGGYKKIEESVVGGFNKIADKFVDNYLTKDGEFVEEARERLVKEQKERGAQIQSEMLTRQVIQDEIVRKNLEASLNAGKR